ncbi:MAG: hypothetical protein WD187_02035 [Candidatus Woykebacteria bacterium]
MVRKIVKKEKTKSFFRSLVALFIMVILSISFARVVFLNVLAASGQQLAAANQETEILKEENQRLENTISQLKSLSRVEKIASEKGFVKAKNVQVLTPKSPIANR